jgi:flagellar assembly protein FliH
MNLSTEPSRTDLSGNEAPAARKYLFDRSFDGEPGVCSPNRKPQKQTYTLAEVEAEKKTAYECGFNAGQKAMMENQQQYMNVLLSQIDQHLATLVREIRTQWQRQLVHFQEMALVIARKVLPAYAERNGLQEIEAIVSHVITEMAHEPRLVVRVGEAQFDAISDEIKRISDQKAYTGKIVVLTEPDLGPADCRVEWADGGIERDINAIWQAIDRLMENARTMTPSPPQPSDDSGEAS